MQHTKEPWIIDSDNHIYAESERKPAPFVDGDEVEYPDFMSGLVALPYGAGDGIKEANAARIVACVNAMAGIADPVAFVASHAELLVALKDLQYAIEKGQSWDEETRVGQALMRAENAIAAAEKGGGGK